MSSASQATSGTTLSGEPLEFEDEGVFLIFFVCLMAFIAIGVLAFVLHGTPSLARLLRPARPGSRFATIFTRPASLADMREDPLLESRGIRPMLQVLMIKTVFYMFLGMCASALPIGFISATDRYLHDVYVAEDPDRCRLRLDEFKCNAYRGYECQYVFDQLVVDPETGDRTTVTGCLPRPRTRLAYLTVRNFTPGSWRLYAFAVICLICCIPVWTTMRGACRVLRHVIRSSFTHPLHPDVKFGGFSTVGARTVVIVGLPPDASFLQSRDALFTFLTSDYATRAALLLERDDSSSSSVSQSPHATSRNEGEEPRTTTTVDHHRASQSYHHRSLERQRPATNKYMQLSQRFPPPDTDAHRRDMLKSLRYTFRARSSESLTRAGVRARSAELGVGGEDVIVTALSASARTTTDVPTSMPAVVPPPAYMAEHPENFNVSAAVSRLDLPLPQPARHSTRSTPLSVVAQSSYGASPLVTRIRPDPATEGPIFAPDGTGLASTERAHEPFGHRNDDAPRESVPLTFRDRCRPLGPPSVNFDDPAHVIAQKAAIVDSISILQDAPADLSDLIEKEKKALEDLADAFALEVRETDPSKKPVQKRLVPKLWRKVPAVAYERSRLYCIRKRLVPRLAARDEQKPMGAVTITFDRASSAYAFVEAFNREEPWYAPRAASIAGSPSRVEWHNLDVPRTEAGVRVFFLFLLMAILVILWSLPVAFFVNIENIQELPTIGPPIVDWVKRVNPSAAAIIAGVFAALVILAYHKAVPRILKRAAKSGGSPNKDRQMFFVLVMAAGFMVTSAIIIQAAVEDGFFRFANLVASPDWQSFLHLLGTIAVPTSSIWYTLLVPAACIGRMARLVQPSLLMRYFIKRNCVARQQAYDNLFALRHTRYAYGSGRHLFYSCVGMLLHGTVAFLQPFAALYTGIAYIVQRSIMTDGAKIDDETVLDYGYILAFCHIIIAMHTVAAFINTCVCIWKEVYGAAAIAGLGIIASLLLHVYVRLTLARVVRPSPEFVASVERDADHLMLPREQLEDAEPYVPEYSSYEIDWAAEARLLAEAAETPEIDKRWPPPETALHHDMEMWENWCGGGRIAREKKQTAEELERQVKALEIEHDILRARVAAERQDKHENHQRTIDVDEQRASSTG